MQIINLCLNGPISLQQAGMQYIVWFLKHCEESRLQSKAKELLDLLWEEITFHGSKLYHEKSISSPLPCPAEITPHLVLFLASVSTSYWHHSLTGIM